jgi:hypothetical protein
MYVPAANIIYRMVQARGASVAALPSVVKLCFVVEDATSSKGTATTAGAITARTTLNLRQLKSQCLIHSRIKTPKC